MSPAASPSMAASASSKAELSPRPVVCVSHGFQSNYERGFSNALAARGADVTLVASDQTDFAGLVRGVHAVNLRGSTATDRPRMAKIANLLRYHSHLLVYAVRRRSSVLHVMGTMWPLFLCGLVEGLWFRLVCWRYVLTVHDVLPHGQVTAWQRHLCRWSYRLPHKLVVHTPKMKDTLVEDFGIPRARITVMEHGLEPPPPFAERADRQARTSGPLRLLAFGAVAPRKGTDLLLEALAQVSFPFQLVIAGACPDQRYRRHLQTAISEHPCRASIEWHDRYVSEAEANALFDGADAVVLPYRYIDQSGVLFQALRFGVPIVATRVGQFERYITPELGELAESGDAFSLRQALERWAARYVDLSRERIRQIGKAYEWPATVAVLEEVYR